MLKFVWNMAREKNANQLLTQLIQLAEENDIWMFSEVDNRNDQSGNREMFYQKYR